MADCSQFSWTIGLGFWGEESAALWIRRGERRAASLLADDGSRHVTAGVRVSPPVRYGHGCISRYSPGPD